MYTAEENRLHTSGFLSSFCNNKLLFNAIKKSHFSVAISRREHIPESTVNREICVPRTPVQSVGPPLARAESLEVRTWAHSQHSYGIQRVSQLSHCRPSATHSISLKFGIDRILSTEFDTKQKASACRESPSARIDFMQYQMDQYYAALVGGICQSPSEMSSFGHATRETMQQHLEENFPGPYAVLSNDTVPQTNRRKRSWSRAVFSNLQRKGLEKRFEVQKYVTKPDRKQLAGMLGLTDAQVKVWFQNRRMKWRHSKEAHEHKNKAQQYSKHKVVQADQTALERVCESERPETELLDGHERR